MPSITGFHALEFTCIRKVYYIAAKSTDINEIRSKVLGNEAIWHPHFYLTPTTLQDYSNLESHLKSNGLTN